MRHLATYLLLKIGGNENPTAEDIKNALQPLSIDVDEERLNALISELEGKDLAELVNLGKSRLVSASASSAAAAPAAASGDKPKVAEKVAEKPKVEEVDALDGGTLIYLT